MGLGRLRLRRLRAPGRAGVRARRGVVGGAHDPDEVIDERQLLAHHRAGDEVLIANLAGAFALGVLLEALVRRGADHGGRRIVRLTLGTGFLGGFTTYSALATDTAALWGAGGASLGTVYAVGSVLVGALATAAGILLAAALHRPHADAGGPA